MASESIEKSPSTPSPTPDAFHHSLDWPKLVRLAQAEARTLPGKALLHELHQSNSWASHLSAAKRLQQETLEITPLLDRDALWGPLTELADPIEVLERLGLGGILEISELALIRGWLYGVDSWTQIPREEIGGELFKKTLSQLPDPFNTLRILESVLTPDGELSEKASPKLSSLYAEIRHCKKEINLTLDHLVKSFSQQGLLQENFTDVRDGRYVLPIRAGAQHEVEGNIYEASASRQTVFIEPKEVTPLNNRLRQKQNELTQEIYLILQSTSKKLQPFSSEITESVRTLSYWDATQAKARIGRHYAGKPIQVTSDRRFRLSQTAHPLLWWSLPEQEIIRNDIDFGHPTSTLLLTGPNTGGKTVLLKTLGIAGICARTGFPFPATDHPSVPFFDSFFADLGDPQSIEAHLSTFSGHVLKFRQILAQLTDQSLILIDELNSATDPEEGAAFGRAVLETLMAQGAMIVSTTHDPLLKSMAVADPRVLCASMSFHEQSRTPSYHMILGVPGRSRALETAERLGIPKEIITLAKSYLSRQHNEFEERLSHLEQSLKEAARARHEAITLRQEAERLKKEWVERTQTSVQDVLDKTRQKLRRILEQAQDEVRSTVKKLDEARNRKEIDKTRSHLNQVFEDHKTQLDSAFEEEAPEIVKVLPSFQLESAQKSDFSTPSKIEVGVQVKIPKWKNVGTVVEVQGDRYKVAMGNLQVSLSRNEIEPTHSTGHAPHRTSPTPSYSSQSSRGSDLGTTLDLRGERFEEAMSQLALYLDQIFRLESYTEVTIVHGLGTGALREGTLKLLGKLPYVKDYRDGGPGRGGTGATIVEFERNV